MRVFQAVAETGGFTSAAHVLEVSQPFVSQTIGRLEDRLSTKLLHRSTRGQRLTAEGRTFLKACRRAIDTVDAAEAELLMMQGRISGELRVAAPLAFGLDQLVPILPEFLQHNSELNVSLSLSDDSVNLIEDQIDVAIRMGQLRDSSMMSQKLCNLRRIVVASPEFITRHGPPRTPPELARYNCLLWDGAREHLNRWTFQVGDSIQTVHVDGNFRSDNGMSLYEMCLAGSGIMRLAEHLARPGIAGGKIIPLLEEFPSLDDSAFYAVFLPERDLLPRIRVFVDYLVARFRVPPW